MGVESLLVFIIIGAIAGWLAGLIVSGFGFGLIGNIIVGIVGAFMPAGCFRGSAFPSAAALSPRSSMPRSAPSSCWYWSRF